MMLQNGTRQRLHRWLRCWGWVENQWRPSRDETFRQFTVVSVKEFGLKVIALCPFRVLLLQKETRKLVLVL